MSDTRPTRRRTWRRPVVLLAAAGALGAGLLTGCGSSAAAADGPSTASSMPATATTIMIEGFRFEIPTSVGPGATVRVMNMDGEAHTVTSDEDGAFSVAVPAGSTVTFTAPTTAGSYDFHCEYHSTMHGTLVVR